MPITPIFRDLLWYDATITWDQGTPGVAMASATILAIPFTEPVGGATRTVRPGRILESYSEVITTFDGTTPEILFGTSAGGNQIAAVGETTLGTAGLYPHTSFRTGANGLLTTAVGTTLYFRFNRGVSAPTQGAVRFICAIYPD